jgi:hypothetical protein
VNAAMQKINLPAVDFEAFNALDVCVEAEIQEISANLRVMPASSELARASLRRYLSRLEAARLALASARPDQYRQMIQSQFAQDSVCEDA